MTYKAHALVVGALVGGLGSFIGLPVPEAFGSELGGSILAYTFAGGVAMVAYPSIVGTIRNTIEHLGARKP